jgi:heptosyltransferase-2
VWRVAEKIRAKSFDEVYILPRSFRTALEMWLARIPRRIGFSGDMRSLMLTEVVPYDSHLLYAQRYLKLIGEEKVNLEENPPIFPRKELDRAKEELLFKGPLRKLKRPLFAMAPASIAPARMWEPGRFSEVASKILEERGGTVVLFGSKSEQNITAMVGSKIKGAVVDTAGQLDLPELGWVLSQCDFLLANDSGLMHVASCFQVPSVVLFGPSDPTYALPPWGRFVPIQHKEISCVPCLRNHCVRLGDHYKECMNTIGVSEVLGKC